MKRIMLRIAYISCLIVAADGANSLLSQSSNSAPSIEDTSRYVSDLMNDHGCTSYMDDYGGGVQFCASDLKIESCTASWTDIRTVTLRGNQLQPQRNSRKMYLSSLDPTSLKTSPFAPGGGLLVEISITSRAISLDLPIDNDENATHLINALGHAIDLCGGKKSAF